MDGAPCDVGLCPRVPSFDLAALLVDPDHIDEVLEQGAGGLSQLRLILPGKRLLAVHQAIVGRMLQGKAHVLLAHAPELLDAGWRGAGVAGPQTPVETLEPRDRDRDQERRLVGEVAVGRAARYAEAAADRSHRHAGRAALRDHGRRFVDERRSKVSVVVGARPFGHGRLWQERIVTAGARFSWPGDSVVDNVNKSMYVDAVNMPRRQGEPR